MLSLGGEASGKSEIPQCFVLMPFTVRDYDKQSYPDPRHWDEVYEGLVVPAVRSAGLSCARDDSDRGSRLIGEHILRKIEQADIVLCDLSSHNPNVFLELGWALRSDKRFVLIKDDLTVYTFDLNQYYTFDYDHRLQPTILRRQTAELTEVLKKTIADQERRYSVVGRLRLSLSAIEALSQPEISLRLLGQIHQAVVNLPHLGVTRLEDEWGPWRLLLRRATHVLCETKRFLTQDLNGTDVVGSLSSLASRLGVSSNREIQMSVINEQTRTFVYHDWPEMIGASAASLFSDSFEYPEGAIAWVDSGSNIRGAAPDVVLRLNIALFSLVGSDRCVLVEVHQEKIRST